MVAGTPLQNNIRELFNLMHFVDRHRFSDLKALEKQYSDLSNESVRSLHEAIKPYFLRRTKNEVLGSLPPKVGLTSVHSPDHRPTGEPCCVCAVDRGDCAREHDVAAKGDLQG